MPSDPASLTPARLGSLFLRHRTLLLAPAIAGVVLAAGSTVVIPRDWEAEQGLLIRSEAAGYADQRLGKFTDLSEMKTVQETLLELARSNSVVSSVLTEIRGSEPDRQDIEDFRDSLRLTPPGGAEFGKTEVFYIGYLHPDRDTAIQTVQLLTKQLDGRMNRLRHDRASSMVSEVDRSVGLAREQLHAHVEKLSAFEQAVGADLIELRHLTSPGGGQSELGQKDLAIDNERRSSAERQRQNVALLAELKAAMSDPSRILATPDTLLASQPGLRRLKNGLVDSQLTVARTAGVRTPNHPYVLAARKVQEAVQKELVRELPTAIAGVELELEVAKRRETDLVAQQQKLRGHSADLAGKRSEYVELVANVEAQNQVLSGALKQLADAKSHLAGSDTSSLLAPIDRVETGAHPVGPGRTTIAGAGGLGGLILGATLVFVLHAPRDSDPGAQQPVVHAPVAPQPTPVDSFSNVAAPQAASVWGLETASRAAPALAPTATTPVAVATATTVASDNTVAAPLVGV